VDGPTAFGPTEPAGDPAVRDRSERRRLLRLKIIFPFLAVLAFLAWAFTTNYIPSDSMQPTLKPGDHILVMRSWLAYPRGQVPDRGDIVTFLPPDEALALLQDGPPEPKGLGLKRPEVWIKRVVGLPGETILIRGGRIFVNGSPLPETFYPGMLSPWEERRYNYATWRPLKLRQDELFVMGDNASDSDDSRFWGPLKRKYLLGRFVRVLFREGPAGPNELRAQAADG
jgi:signal peptidase I